MATASQGGKRLVSVAGRPMPAPEVMAGIEANDTLAEKRAITGTPACIISDGVMRGYAPLDAMRDLVAEARTDGQASIGAGSGRTA